MIREIGTRARARDQRAARAARCTSSCTSRSTPDWTTSPPASRALRLRRRRRDLSAERRRRATRAAAGRAGRPAERRQVVAVQPPGRRAARAGRGHAGRDARSPLRRGRLGPARFRVVDTGGLDPSRRAAILGGMRAADAARRRRGRPGGVRRRRAEGVTAVDTTSASVLRRSGKPVLMRRQQGRLASATSAAPPRLLRSASTRCSPSRRIHGRGVGELLDAVVARAAPGAPRHCARRRRPSGDDDETRADPAGAWSGKPNVGKSSLVNRLARRGARAGPRHAGHHARSRSTRRSRSAGASTCWSTPPACAAAARSTR